MYEEKVVLENEAGLHARPASLFIQRASEYKSNINIIKDSTRCNGKSIISVLSLGAKKGVEITIRGDGVDEKEAVISLVKLVKTGFGEK
ncbi:MAG: HPr family phosphocarrier protein [Anaerosolibacter sp.]|jgi:phosphocarrier protein|uniref:HPr family phosphocarrier protein n=1 Tax=Anaerosolibacter sp. TaxID=1872527 RepID=UPI00260F939B|nr:HPr family phosphocarrier protein [Anaerosolibacter sp.]MDF2548405.1 HPr family phosphocarrier protein [Anaerosolibacter sp.]